MANLIGQILLKQYRVDSFIASGGMGAVYKVWDLKRNVPLAMKVLHADLADDPSVFKRFEREARALQQLKHPNVVPFYGLFQEMGQSFLLEEFIEGNSLQTILRERSGQPLPVDQAIVYMKGLCAALHYAHANRVVHCDIKPGNVLVSRQGNIFLADFGIAKFIDATTTTTMGGAGTPSYMAPEQITGRGVAPVTDIYALGVMLFEMLTGQRPFSGTEAGSQTGGNTPSERVRFAHLRLPPPDPRQINPNLSPALSKMILRGLTKNPAERFRSAQEFFFALCQAAQSQPEQIADTTTIIGDFIQRPLQAAPVQRTSTTPRPRKKQEMSSSQKGIIALLVTGAILIFAITGLAIGMNTSSGDASPMLVTLTNSLIPSATFPLLPPTETLTNAPSPTIGASRTPVLPPDTFTPFLMPTKTFTPTETSTPTPSDTPTSPAPPTEVSTSAPLLPDNQISCPVGTVAKESPLDVPFSSGQFGPQTAESYNGAITLVVSGTGQAENRKWSDAFYLYTDKNEIPIHPPSHPNGGIFSINKKIVDKFTSYESPPYSSDHIYTFSINAPGGKIMFGVFDSVTFDNTGGYTVIVCQ
jgi:serine/threonine protein kinase